MAKSGKGMTFYKSKIKMYYLFYKVFNDKKKYEQSCFGYDKVRHFS